jgi:predicted anti-sigma-YlaC factor YlaD
MDVRPNNCDRAAELVSLELDDELSRFERALLKRHLRRCDACAAYAVRVTAATEILRGAPLEAVRVPIAIPSFRRRFSRVAQSVAATAAVAAFGIWFAVSSSGNVSQHVQQSGFDVSAGLSSDASSVWPGSVVPKRRPRPVTPFLPGGRLGLHGRVS